MLWILLANQVIMMTIASAACAFAYKASKDSRWLQEVVVPQLAHMVQVIDPSYPKPPDPPPIEG